MRQTTLHHGKFLLKKHFLFCLLFLSFWSYSIQAQTPVSFCISSATDNGNGVTLAVTTENFTDIVSTQFTIEWNPNDLELITTGNFNPLLQINNSNFTPPPISNPTGQMVFSWIDGALTGKTLTLRAILFSMTFAVNTNATAVQISELDVIEVTDVNGNFLDVDLKTGTVNAVGGKIIGNIFSDNNSDCMLSSGEIGLENWILKFENTLNTFFATSDESGNFEAFVPLGNYVVSLEEIHPYWEACNANFNIDVLNPGGLAELKIPIKPIIDCPALEINISSTTLQQCSSNNTYTIDYCNLGTVTSTGSFIEVTLDDFLTVTSSPISFSSLGDNVYSFDVADIEVGACNSFDIIVDVSCDAPLGITHCASVQIFPNDYCGLTDPLWSEASLKITGECNANQDSVIFTIENKGSGNMINNSIYIVIEDVLMLQSPTPLDPIPSGGNRKFAYPATGTTYRMEVDQVDFHPGNSMPSATVEGCVSSTSTPISTGFITQLPQDDGDTFVSIDCRENTGAVIANNKEASPTGFGDEHYIEANTDIEYLIRFENTSSNSVQDLIIRDTLSEFLDATTVRGIASSHAYEYEVTGEGVAVFKFADINLSNNSNGFVQFKISQLPDVPLETIIENTSAIHFGINAPVITNTVFHTIGDQFISVKTKRIFNPNLAVSVYPNPSRDVVHFEIIGEKFQSIELKLFDLRGSLIYSATSPNELITFYRNDIPAGVYAFSLSSDGALLSTGKFMID